MTCSHCSTELAPNDWIAVCLACDKLGCRHCVYLSQHKAGYAATPWHTVHDTYYMLPTEQEQGSDM